jgi:nicotinamidase-related amidase
MPRTPRASRWSNDNFGRWPSNFRTLLETTTMILTGLTGDRCVLFIASDAFMRDFQLWVPADCVASLDPAHNRRALDEMARLFGADLTESTRLALSRSGVRRRGRAAAARSRSG